MAGNKMNGKWSKENFLIFDANNPSVYEMFCRFTLQAAAKRRYFSAKAIFHRIRWETMIVGDDSSFKIDDGWISHYARKFLAEHPEHAGFFEIRHRRESYHSSED